MKAAAGVKWRQCLVPSIVRELEKIDQAVTAGGIREIFHVIAVLAARVDAIDDVDRVERGVN